MSQPTQGEFRVARGADACPRTMFVVKHQEYPCSKVMLMSHEVELRTLYDVLLHPSETGLPIPVVVETDMCILILDSQLDEEPIGRLAEVPDYLSRLLPEPSTLPADRVGRALNVPDTRRQWKELELHDLIMLQRPFYALATGNE
jgi:hypothetical protein